MTELAGSWRAHLRLALLRVLAAAPGYAANDCLLVDAVWSVGIRASRDQVRGELQWLREAGLIGIDHLAGLMLAAISPRGLDVANGRGAHPGIKRPPPPGE